MIINETLRLYPPVVNLERRVKGDIKLGKFNLSANMIVTTPTLALHQDTRIWGDNVHLFNPERFSEGIAKATNNKPCSISTLWFGAKKLCGKQFCYKWSKDCSINDFTAIFIHLVPNLHSLPGPYCDRSTTTWCSDITPPSLGSYVVNQLLIEVWSWRSVHVSYTCDHVTVK